MRFNPPPNWPQPPAGWQPPQGWKPDPAWGPAPEGWQLWVNDDQPAASPRPAAKKSWFGRHKVLTGLGIGVIAVVGLTAVAGGGEDSPTASPPADTSGLADADSGEAEAAVDADTEGTDAEAEAPTQEESLAGIGDTVSGGGMDFTVNGIECGETTLGSEYLSTEAQGEFCILDVSITNTGDTAAYVSTETQYLYDADGKEYSASTEAGMYYEDGEILLEEINPGNTVDGAIIFDVPEGTTPTEASLGGGLLGGDARIFLK